MARLIRTSTQINNLLNFQLLDASQELRAGNCVQLVPRCRYPVHGVDGDRSSRKSAVFCKSDATRKIPRDDQKKPLGILLSARRHSLSKSLLARIIITRLPINSSQQWPQFNESISTSFSFIDPHDLAIIEAVQHMCININHQAINIPIIRIISYIAKIIFRAIKLMLL